MILIGIFKNVAFFSLMFIGCECKGSQSAKYQQFRVDAKFPIPQELIEARSASECSVLCDYEPECISVNFNQVEHQCELTDHYPQKVVELTDGIGPNADHLTIISIPDWSIYYKENQFCTYDYTVHFTSEATRVKQSINYPSNYNTHENYYWLFIKPSATSTLYLDFTVMNVEQSSGCSYDSITIYSGVCTDAPILAKICGYTPQTITDTRGTYVLLNFRSDGFTQGTGFSMNYYIALQTLSDSSRGGKLRKSTI